MNVSSLPLLTFVYAGVAYATLTDQSVLDACPGYKATAVTAHGNTLTADLALAGTACNVFGQDIDKLKLEVTYETSTYSVYPGSVLL